MAPDRHDGRGVDESEAACLQALGDLLTNTVHLAGEGGGAAGAPCHMGTPRSISPLSAAALHGTQAHPSDGWRLPGDVTETPGRCSSDASISLGSAPRIIYLQLTTAGLTFLQRVKVALKWSSNLGLSFPIRAQSRWTLGLCGTLSISPTEHAELSVT